MTGARGTGEGVPELEAATRSLVKRLHGLLQVAQGRMASPRFLQAARDAAELLEAAGRSLSDPTVPVPRLRADARDATDPAHVARSMRRALAGAAHAEAMDITGLAPQVVLRGRCESVAVPELLEFLAQMRKSGVLHVKTREETFSVFLRNGDVVHAVSNNGPAEDRLGAILVEQGALTEARLEGFLESFSRWKGRIGDALLRDGLVTEEALQRALETQVRRLFDRMTRARPATFTFSEGHSAGSEARLRLSVVALLLDAARRKDEKAAR